MPYLGLPSTSEGSFIFVSYCHADAEDITKLEILTNLAKEFNICYDEELTLGDDLDEQIEEKIAHSAIVMPFISPAAINKAESWVQVEIDLAITKYHKPLLPIYLKETDLPGTLRAKLQNLLGFNVWNPDYSTSQKRAVALSQSVKDLWPSDDSQQSLQQAIASDQNASADVPNNWQTTIATRLIQVGDKEPAPDWLAQLPIPEESDLPETTRHLIADLLIDRLERFPDDMENTQAWFKSLLFLPDAAAQPA